MRQKAKDESRPIDARLDSARARITKCVAQVSKALARCMRAAQHLEEEKQRHAALCKELQAACQHELDLQTASSEGQARLPPSPPRGAGNTHIDVLERIVAGLERLNAHMRIAGLEAFISAAKASLAMEGDGGDSGDFDDEEDDARLPGASVAEAAAQEVDMDDEADDEASPQLAVPDDGKRCFAAPLQQAVDQLFVVLAEEGTNDGRLLRDMAARMTQAADTADLAKRRRTDTVDAGDTGDEAESTMPTTWPL